MNSVHRLFAGSMLLAITFVHAYAANVFFPPGTNSASVWQADTGNINSENILSSNNVGRWLVFDDDSAYTVAGINLRNTVWEGEDSGIYIQTGVLDVLGAVTLGGNDNTRGFVEMTGGELYIGGAMSIAGRAASGSFTATDAYIELAGNLTINTAAATEATTERPSQGELTLGGTTMMTANGNTIIGNAGASAYGSAIATVTVKDQATFSTNTSSSFFTIGALGGSEAFFTVSDEGIVNSGRTIIGDQNGSKGTLVVTGSGSFNAFRYTILGNRNGGSGTISLMDYGIYNGTDLQAGGTSNITEGTGAYGYFSAAGHSQAIFANDAYIGHGVNSDGVLSVSDDAFFTAANISVADASGASGTVSITGGTISTGDLLVGRADGASGTISITGGTVSVSGTLNLSLMVSNASTKAYYSQTGGQLTAQEVYVGSNNADNVSTSATVVLTGGSLTSNTFFNIGSSTNNGSAGAHVTVSGNAALKTVTLSVMREGYLSVSGTLLLAQNPALTSGQVSAQTFRASNGSQVQLGAVELRQGGYMQVGTDAHVQVNGNVSLSADDSNTSVQLNVLAGGNLAVNGDLIFNRNARMAIAANAEFTGLQVGGNIVFSGGDALGTQHLTLDLRTFTDLAVGDEFTVLTATGSISGFDQWYDLDNVTAMFSDASLSLESLELSDDGKSIIANIGAAIPEPAQVVWLLGALALVAAARRR